MEIVKWQRIVIGRRLKYRLSGTIRPAPGELKASYIMAMKSTSTISSIASVIMCLYYFYLFQFATSVPLMSHGFQKIMIPHHRLHLPSSMKKIYEYDLSPSIAVSGKIRNTRNSSSKLYSSKTNNWRSRPSSSSSSKWNSSSSRNVNNYNKRSNSRNKRFNNNNYNSKEKRRRARKDQAYIDGQRLEDAIQVEARLTETLKHISAAGITNSMSGKKFPSVRECNSAIAAFGDSGDFTRALNLFAQMRKSTSLVASLTNKVKLNSNVSKDSTSTEQKGTDDYSFIMIFPPVPTLVTYSTLMSRAVSLGKPLVALRLWRLMTIQKEFYTNVSAENKKKPSQNNTIYKNQNSNFFGAPIVPDVRAVNILLNAYAKLADTDNAEAVLEQMIYGKVNRNNMQKDQNDEEFDSIISVIPKMDPNIVTWNTLIDACNRAGDLDVALGTFQHMKQMGIQPDARTYTSLISTVGRRATKSSGASDPDMAFSFMQEMINSGIRPNGMTYCALIEVCGRCRRSDLALKGIRMMMRQKVKEQRLAQNNYQIHRSNQKPMKNEKNYNARNQKKNPFMEENVLFNEVGAWTAAINACGKAGRLNTAIRLFHTMSKFGAKPNTVTCGCLADCLLRANPSRVAETLDVLRYMKDEGIEPSEVMYTSLISSAGRLTEMENKIAGMLRRKNRKGELVKSVVSQKEKSNDTSATAIELYTELMRSMMKKGKRRYKFTKYNNHNLEASNHLMKVFLVFQEMKAAGATPDVACYNALLQACARSGDVSRIKDVLRRMENDRLNPNEISWRVAIRGAAQAKRSEVAEEFWDMALAHKYEGSSNENNRWKPGAKEFNALISSYMAEAREALKTTNANESSENVLILYKNIIQAYVELTDAKDSKLQLQNVDLDEVQENEKTMSTVLHAVVSLEESLYKSYVGERKQDGKEVVGFQKKLRQVGTSIAYLNCFEQPSLNYDKNVEQYISKAKSWTIN